MATIENHLIARTADGNGAIQVESAQERGLEPLMVMVGGPIKHWWMGDNWGSDLHNHFIGARKQVRDALITAGHCTYFPNEAIKGSWTERAQLINDAAIINSDVFVRLDLPGVPAVGTDEEERVANDHGVPVLRVNVSAATLEDQLAQLLADLEALQKS